MASSLTASSITYNLTNVTSTDGATVTGTISYDMVLASVTAASVTVSHNLAAVDKLFLGTSSWKYEGWLGQIYSPERYLVRGRFSAKRFDEECLAEYAETFPIVCGDFAFYQFPTATSWRKLFNQVPAPFQFAFKVPEEITLPVFPSLPRYGLRAGQGNPNFLSAEMTQTQFLDLLRPYADRVALLVFELGAAIGRAFDGVNSFAEALSKFLASLPTTFRYGVEIRQAQFLEPEYFRALRENGVAHVFNSWTEMPGIDEQMNSEAFTSNFTAARALIRPGRGHENSVRMFAPYREVKEPNAEVRAALRELLVRAKKRAEPTFVFVNNRLEGFAPGTIAAIIDAI
jgi:uncharacterized protein YecE (DUF72 family)